MHCWQLWEANPRYQPAAGTFVGDRVGDAIGAVVGVTVAGAA